MRVMAQVALGEVLASPTKDAYLAINSKRVDFILIREDGNPLHAIEYQGSGHHQGDAAIRDAIKREALRRAGIGYTEIAVGDTPDDVRAIVRKLGNVYAPTSTTSLPAAARSPSAAIASPPRSSG